MPDLSIPVIVAVAFVAIGWLITRAGPRDADAIRHTLSVFALALGVLALGGTMAKLHARLGLGRMPYRVEARSQVERASPVRPAQKESVQNRP